MRRSTSRTGHRSQRRLQKQRDVKRNLWREPQQKVGALIPSIAGEKRFAISRDDALNYGEIALEEIKGFLSLLAAFSAARVELNTEIWQADDLDSNDQLFKVQWAPYSKPQTPKKRNGSIKWNEARRYSRRSPMSMFLSRMTRRMSSEVIDVNTMRERMGL